ncbi:uncharacterized protein PAC_18717 [Phialocephala subalpina]|uniref:Uncharacterized protein n=1 Tax=Phialocephala subalpina TaxID=576137 RepID=A0A1L7XUZ3_9HELO|nr:uncharacterized protein PAC_18717 [Phialocephala subalpina]
MSPHVDLKLVSSATLLVSACVYLCNYKILIMDQGWVLHKSIGLYFRWDNLTARYIWATKEYSTNALGPLRPGPLRDEWERNYELSADFRPHNNVSFDPFMQYILDWGISKGEETIHDRFYADGGWEAWVQSETHSDLPDFVDRYDALWREQHVYANSPGDKADLLLSLEPAAPAQPSSVLLELKVELGRSDPTRSRVPEMIQKVRDDIQKIQNANLHYLVPISGARVGRPCHAYVVALTVTDEGYRAMERIGMSLEPSRQRQGEATCPFKVWWFRRVIN